MAMYQILIGCWCALSLFAVIIILDWLQKIAPQTPEEQEWADNEQVRILNEMYKEKHAKNNRRP